MVLNASLWVHVHFFCVIRTPKVITSPPSGTKRRCCHRRFSCSFFLLKALPKETNRGEVSIYLRVRDGQYRKLYPMHLQYNGSIVNIHRAIPVIPVLCRLLLYEVYLVL